CLGRCAAWEASALARTLTRVERYLARAGVQVVFAAVGHAAGVVLGLSRIKVGQPGEQARQVTVRAVRQVRAVGFSDHTEDHKYDEQGFYLPNMCGTFVVEDLGVHEEITHLRRRSRCRVAPSR